MRYSALIAVQIFNAVAILAGEFPAIYNTEAGQPPFSADRAAQTAQLPKGFEMQVFACEPDVQQPISIAFDEQQRLWVAECFTFAERPQRWDLKLRDRILVLEDTDDDGRADKRTVFWDQGRRLTSALPGKGGVWALCAPHLLFIPDTDGDLVPDGPPIVMLEGFDSEHIGHNIVNGLKWGPDGWIYGRHGITGTSLVGTPDTPKSRRQTIDCSIWRFHPVTRKFEVYCRGGTNPWGMDWDANGQLFYTNTVIGHLWHAIPGAYYERMFGSHLNPYVYEAIPQTADHYHWDTGSERWNDTRKEVSEQTSIKGGGHAHMGCLIYQAGVWPESYHGHLFTCNLHGRRINRENLKRQGVGYVATHEDDFLVMEDPWFRGLDLITGPEGHMWVNDWSDTGECHDNDGIHRSSGRIYRIVYRHSNEVNIFNPRPSWLTERASEDLSSNDIDQLLQSNDEAKVAMGVRWLSEDHPHTAATQLLTLAKSNPQPLVRLELAAALQRLPLEQRLALAFFLAKVELDSDDRQQSLLIWYGVEQAVPLFPESAIKLVASSKHQKLSKLITRRFCELYESHPENIEQLLSSDVSPDIASAILTGLAEGFQGWRSAPQPANWQSFCNRYLNLDEDELQELSLVFGDGRTRKELILLVRNGKADAAAREAALRNLLNNPSDDLLPILLKLTNDKSLALPAVRGLARYDHPSVPERLIKFAAKSPVFSNAAIDTLVSRTSYASGLLQAIEDDVLDSEVISAIQARQIINLGDVEIESKLIKLWGNIRETPEQKKIELAQWKEKLSDEVIAAADPQKGKHIFTKACGGCHRLYGEGGVMGPDLTGSDRHSIDYLLQNIVDPNDVVSADYRLTVLRLKDGRVISGVIPNETEKTITIQSMGDVELVAREQIVKQETLSNSGMPEGLLDSIDEKAVADLMRYLMSNERL